LLELRLGFAVYGYMNGLIFKIFGVAIIVFEELLVVMFCFLMATNWVRGKDLLPVLIVLGGLLLFGSVIAIGLIYLQRWAAITASIVGLVWGLMLASTLRSAPWDSLLIGAPIVISLLAPLYATLRNWPALRSVDNLSIKPYFDVLRSSDPLHLK